MTKPRLIADSANDNSIDGDRLIDGSVPLSKLSGSGSFPSSSIGYTSPETGAEARTVEEKLSDAVSVKDFGAVGDGVAYDGDAIQAALDTGKPVLFPAGRYLAMRTDGSGNPDPAGILNANADAGGSTYIYGEGEAIIDFTGMVPSFTPFLISGLGAGFTMENLTFYHASYENVVYTDYKSPSVFKTALETCEVFGNGSGDYDLPDDPTNPLSPSDVSLTYGTDSFSYSDKSTNPATTVTYTRPWVKVDLSAATDGEYRYVMSDYIEIDPAKDYVFYVNQEQRFPLYESLVGFSQLYFALYENPTDTTPFGTYKPNGTSQTNQTISLNGGEQLVRFGKTASRIRVIIRFKVYPAATSNDNKIYTDMIYMLECINNNDPTYGNIAPLVGEIFISHGENAGIFPNLHSTVGKMRTTGCSFYGVGCTYHNSGFIYHAGNRHFGLGFGYLRCGGHMTDSNFVDAGIKYQGTAVGPAGSTLPERLPILRNKSTSIGGNYTGDGVFQNNVVLNGNWVFEYILLYNPQLSKPGGFDYPIDLDKHEISNTRWVNNRIKAAAVGISTLGGVANQILNNLIVIDKGWQYGGIEAGGVEFKMLISGNSITCPQAYSPGGGLAFNNGENPNSECLITGNYWESTGVQFSYTGFGTQKLTAIGNHFVSPGGCFRLTNTQFIFTNNLVDTTEEHGWRSSTFTADTTFTSRRRDGTAGDSCSEIITSNVITAGLNGLYSGGANSNQSSTEIRVNNNTINTPHSLSGSLVNINALPAGTFEFTNNNIRGPVGVDILSAPSGFIYSSNNSIYGKNRQIGSYDRHFVLEFDLSLSSGVAEAFIGSLGSFVNDQLLVNQIFRIGSGNIRGTFLLSRSGTTWVSQQLGTSTVYDPGGVLGGATMVLNGGTSPNPRLSGVTSPDGTAVQLEFVTNVISL